ncbi:hypothetical protein [Peribacillus frigoritolerans]|uniref:Uncharacterized protein n=1 Tax=Peribacillus frigoritolerans TaxID=450367 RepID=A0AAJ1QM47_9BACI|nr:hypothetical protein [Peribacillus frigoritolerans]MDM5283881.1 hypothetical protein [Peribacillus frigoritolerans]
MKKLSLPFAIVILGFCLLFSAIIVSNAIREGLTDNQGWELLNERLIELIDVLDNQ